jgi:hypothetical protein
MSLRADCLKSSAQSSEQIINIGVFTQSGHTTDTGVKTGGQQHRLYSRYAFFKLDLLLSYWRFIFSLLWNQFLKINIILWGANNEHKY